MVWIEVYENDSDYQESKSTHVHIRISNLGDVLMDFPSCDSRFVLALDLSDATLLF